MCVAPPHCCCRLVGNHQLYAMDMNVLVEEVFLQTGVLLRGLAHPALFKQTKLGQPPGADKEYGGPVAAKVPGSERAAAASSPHSFRLTPAVQAPAETPFPLGDIYRTFGAVAVTPAAFFKLLAAREAVLLYPGGVREGFKRRNERCDAGSSADPVGPQRTTYLQKPCTAGTSCSGRKKANLCAWLRAMVPPSSQCLPWAGCVVCCTVSHAAGQLR
jgi:hypothetical protein